MAKGLIISLSGIDGAGKSTQIRLLQQHLRDRDRRAVYLWTRVGYTGVFNLFKSLLRRALGRRVAKQGDLRQRELAFRRRSVRRLWLTLALLDLIRVYAVQIRLWRLRGRVVICDRYIWDSLVDLRINFADDRVESSWLWRMLVRLTPAPDLALLLTVPVEESIRRSDLKGEPFRDPAHVLAERSRQYRELSEVAAWHVLDGTKPPDALYNDVLRLLESKLSDSEERSSPNASRR